MSEPRKVRSYAYVNRPYPAVHAALRDRPVELLQQATTSASARVGALGASLKLNVGVAEVGVDIRMQVQGVREEEGVAGLSPVTRLPVQWEALRAPGLFPMMSAEVSAWPLSSSETQIEIEGDYRPPLGVVGHAVDAALGHRIAEAAVHRLIEDLVEQLRHDIPEGP